jgi:hypothetical protein
LARRHRTPLQKLVYSDVLRCGKCHYHIGRRHRFIHSTTTFLFSRHTHCIKCGSAYVRRGSRRDHVDTVSNHPLSQVLWLLGAPVNKCFSCRLQYYDWRPPEPAA